MLMGGVAVGAAVAPFLVRWLGGRGAFLIIGVLVVGVGLDSMAAPPEPRCQIGPAGPGCELLLAIPMFSVLEQSLVERLSRDLVRVEIPAGRAVMREGEAGDRFYVIESGVVSILKQDPSSVEPSEVNRLGRGSFFGETALMRDIPRTATVAAVTDLVLYALDRRPFLEAVTGSPLSVVTRLIGSSTCGPTMPSPGVAERRESGRVRESQCRIRRQFSDWARNSIRFAFFRSSC